MSRSVKAEAHRPDRLEKPVPRAIVRTTPWLLPVLGRDLFADYVSAGGVRR